MSTKWFLSGRAIVVNELFGLSGISIRLDLMLRAESCRYTGRWAYLVDLAIGKGCVDIVSMHHWVVVCSHSYSIGDGHYMDAGQEVH